MSASSSKASKSSKKGSKRGKEVPIREYPEEAYHDDKFITIDHVGYYNKLKKQSVTESKYLDQTSLKHDITALFETSSLLSMISMCFAYSKEFLYTFFANMEIPPTRHLITSKVEGINVEFTKMDFHSILGVSIQGPSPYLESRRMNWKDVNLRLRGIPYKKHMGDTASLEEEAHVVQHVLRSSVIPKSGDRESIGPTASLTTYYILTDTQFDAADLLIGYLEKILAVRRPDSKLSRNLALGSVLSYMVFTKYFVLTSDPTDGIPTAFKNANFNSLWPSHESRRRKARRETRDLVRRAAAAEDSDDDEDDDDDDEDDDSDDDDVPSRGYSPATAASTASAPPGLGALVGEMGLLRTAVTEGFADVSTRLDRVDLRFDRLETRVDGLYDIYGQLTHPPPGDFGGQ